MPSFCLNEYTGLAYENKFASARWNSVQFYFSVILFAFFDVIFGLRVFCVSSFLFSLLSSLV